MISRAEQLGIPPSNAVHDLESPFLTEELFAEKFDEGLEAQVAMLERESPFVQAFSGQYTRPAGEDTPLVKGIERAIGTEEPENGIGEAMPAADSEPPLAEPEKHECSGHLLEAAYEEEGLAPGEQPAIEPEEEKAGARAALQFITHAGPYRLAYDRLTTLGVIEPLPGRDKRRFRGTAALQTALNEWADFIPRIMEPPMFILTGGLYVQKPGEHGKGTAIDVDGFWWSSSNQFLANNAPTDWSRYLSIEATLRKVFGTVLNYDYNRAHHDHWHCDLGTPTRWRAVRSQVNFVQRALKEVWREEMTVDGQWSTLVRAAAVRNGFDLGVAGAWDRLLDAIIDRRKVAGPAVTPPKPAGPSPQPITASSRPTGEQIRFAQRVLNAAEGERLAVDGDLGPLTRAALVRFRNRLNLGTGGVLDERTELALAQRALEELAQQSLFAQPGVRDAITEQTLRTFKAQHGLGFSTTLDPATRAALAEALVQRGGSLVLAAVQPGQSTISRVPDTRFSEKVVAAVGRYTALAESASTKYGMDSALILGVIAAESGGNKDLVAKSGYTGLMQAGKGARHKEPATSIEEGTRKLRDFRIIMERVLKKSGERYDQLPATEQLRLLALSYNAGPVTIAKALQYASESGQPERWLEAEHYKRAMLFTGAYSLRQAADHCLKGTSASERDLRMREAVQVWNQWRIGTKKKHWRELEDPPVWSVVSARLPAFVLCAIDFKHRNSPKYAARILSYRDLFKSRRLATQVAAEAEIGESEILSPQDHEDDTNALAGEDTPISTFPESPNEEGYSTGEGFEDKEQRGLDMSTDEDGFEIEALGEAEDKVEFGAESAPWRLDRTD